MKSLTTANVQGDVSAIGKYNISTVGRRCTLAMSRQWIQCAHVYLLFLFISFV